MHAGWEELTPGKRYGKATPRVFTPPLRELVPELVDESGRVVQQATTWGYAVIEFARDVLEIDLMPWQRWLLIHMLELGADGMLRFQTAIVLVARQNGKSTLSQVLALWFMIVAKWPLVLGTAQDLTTAEEVWEGAVALLEDDPELTTLIHKLSQRNGKKMVTLSVPGTDKVAAVTRYLVKAASRRAGRGLSGNLILLDELREQTNWAAWGAITKTTNAQVNSLIVGLSNAGDIMSVVLWYLRLMGHAAAGDPDGLNSVDDLSAGLPMAGPTVLDLDPEDDDDEDALDELTQDEETLFLAEWSAIPGVKIRDRNGWAQANPALGHRVQEKKIAGDARTDPEWVFRTEVLCQWSNSTLEGPFPAGAWEQGQNTPGWVLDADGDPIPGTAYVLEPDIIPGDIWVCIDQSSDRGMVYVTAVGRRRDGQLQAELMAGRAGTEWVKPYLLDDRRRARVKAVTGQWKGAPVSLLVNELAKDPRFTIEVKPWQGGDLMGATGLLFDAVRDVTLRHNVQAPLDIAAATAVMKQLGDGFVIDRHKSESDVAPLVGVAGALWLASQVVQAPAPPPPPPKVVAARSTPTTSRPTTLTGDVASMQF